MTAAEEIAAVLDGSASVDVRYRVAGNTGAPVELLVKLSTDSDVYVRYRVAENTGAPAEALVKLSTDSDVYVRRRVAGNTGAPAELLVKLSTDSDVYVRRRVAGNTGAPVEALRAIAETSGFADDIRTILSAAKTETPELLATLREGRIDGSTYQGACKCLAGTIAGIRHCNYDDLEGDLEADSDRPAEKWFYPIRPGHTPENNARAKVTEEIIVAWMASQAGQAATP